MNTRNRLVSAVVFMMLAVTGATVAQVRTEDGGGSLTALIAEVRQLRVAVEESNRRQSEIQSLGVYLSAQQSRMIHVSARLDAVRNELNAANAQSQHFANLLASAQAEAAQATDVEARQQAVEMSRMFKQQAAGAAEREQQIRDRESELAQALHTEEARWTELIARLEQTVKR